MPKCRITVLKRIVHQDLVDAYMEPGAATLPCPWFVEGQEFIVGDDPVPDFCNAAWNDIYKAYVTLMHGGSFTPWMKQGNTVIACCSDGIRPVIFKLERLDD
jgi:uncharacterized repeat protein (TIGR04076 family)